MTITEEQLAAIKIAIKYIPNWPPACKENCAVDVLRAMIDSSEEFTDAGELINRASQIEYDIEYRKSDCESRQWVKLNAFWFDEMKECIPLLMAEIERLLADLADSEKRNEDLRKGIDDLSKTIFSGAQAARIKELEAENKRVLSELQKSKNRNMCEERVKKDLQQAARIKELEVEIAELKADLEQSERVIEARLDVIDQQTTRIQEPEDALVEERAGAIRTESYDHCEGMYRIDLPDAMIQARQELQAEGKIGPGTVAPPCWLLRGDFQSREELSEEQAEVDAIAEKGA